MLLSHIHPRSGVTLHCPPHLSGALPPVRQKRPRPHRAPYPRPYAPRSWVLSECGPSDRRHERTGRYISGRGHTSARKSIRRFSQLSACSEELIKRRDPNLLTHIALAGSHIKPLPCSAPFDVSDSTLERFRGHSDYQSTRARLLEDQSRLLIIPVPSAHPEISRRSSHPGRLGSHIGL